MACELERERGEMRLEMKSQEEATAEKVRLIQAENEEKLAQEQARMKEKMEAAQEEMERQMEVAWAAQESAQEQLHASEEKGRRNDQDLEQLTKQLTNSHQELMNMQATFKAVMMKNETLSYKLLDLQEAREQAELESKSKKGWRASIGGAFSSLGGRFASEPSQQEAGATGHAEQGDELGLNQGPSPPSPPLSPGEPMRAAEPALFEDQEAFPPSPSRWVGKLEDQNKDSYL